MGKSGGTKISVADYLMSIHFGLCKGELDQINQVYVKELPIWCGQISNYQAIPVDLPDLFGGDKKEGGVKGTMECYFGTADQMMTVDSANRYAKTPTTMPGYRGIGNMLFRGNTTGGFKWISNNPYLPGTWVNLTRIPKGLSPEFAFIYSADPDYADEIPLTVAVNGNIGAGAYFKLSDLGITDAEVDAGLVSIQMSIAAVFTGVGLGEGIPMSGFIGVEYQGYYDDGGVPGDIIPSSFANGGGIFEPGGAVSAGEALPPEVRWIRVDMTVIRTFPIFSTATVTNTQAKLTVLRHGPSYCEIDDHLGVLPDANPAHMIYEALTDRDWGMGAPRESIDIDSFMYAAEVFYNERFGLSIIWAEQAEIDTYVSEILDHVQAALFLDPRSGLWTLTPFRADYDAGTLPVLNPTNCKAKNRQRKALGETVNEIVVTWTNPNNEKEETITYQDIGNISAQGGVVSDTRNYYGIRNAALANFVGARDIRSAAYPMFGCDIIADRTMSFLRPGSVAKFTWPEDGIADMIVRVTKVDYGKPGESTVKLSVTEDVFGLEQTVYTGSQETLWTNPDVDPYPMTATEIITSPLPLLLRSGIPLADLSDDDYPIVSVGVFSNRASGDVEYFDLMGPLVKPTGETYTGILGSMAPTSYGTTATAWPAAIRSTINDAQMLAIVGLNTPDTGDFLHIEGPDGDRSSEIVMLDSYAAGVWTLARGMFDTVPRAWPIGTRVWFINDYIKPQDPTEKNSGIAIPYQLLPKSPGGKLRLADAPVINFTPSDRPYCPFRPANIAMVPVGGTAPEPYPTTVQNGGAEISALTGWSAVADVTSVTSAAFTPAPLLPISGSRFFTCGSVPIAQMEQRLSVPAAMWDAVDTSPTEMNVTWFQAGFDTTTDSARVELDFYDASLTLISSFVGTDQFGGAQAWLARSQFATIPSGTRSVMLRFSMVRTSGTVLNVSIDDIKVAWGTSDFPSLLFIGAGIPTSLDLSWSNRNRLSEDIVAPRWNEATVTPEMGQTTTIRARDKFSGSVELVVTGLTGTTYSLALASLTTYRFYEIEFASVRDGFESIQAGKLEIQLVRLGYGNNYGYDYGENDGDS